MPMPDSSFSGTGRLQQLVAELPERLQRPAEVLRQLLREVVEQAVAAVGSAVGSILVPDVDGKNLRFLVSHDPNADHLTHLRVPIDKSIAGYVYNTGQMMALGDLSEETTGQFYGEVDQQLNFATRTYLVLPVSHKGRIRGVATYVNRPGPQPYRPFQPEEMELAKTFAVLEGALLHFFEGTRQLSRIVGEELSAGLAIVDTGQPLPVVQPEPVEERVEPWARMLRVLDRLSEEEQLLCADLIHFLEQRFFHEHR